jgi:hypothetical protein
MRSFPLETASDVVTVRTPSSAFMTALELGGAPEDSPSNRWDPARGHDTSSQNKTSKA